jgi:hypothetical protein
VDRRQGQRGGRTDGGGAVACEAGQRRGRPGRTCELELNLHRVLLEVSLKGVEVLLQPCDVRLERRVVVARLLGDVLARPGARVGGLLVGHAHLLLLVVLLRLVAAFDLLEVAHAITRKHRVLELHCSVASAGTRHRRRRQSRCVWHKSVVCGVRVCVAQVGGLRRAPHAPGCVGHALEAVDVKLPDEGAQVVVLEVQRQHVLRPPARHARRSRPAQVRSASARPLLLALPRPRTCANFIRSMIRNESPISLQQMR